MISVRSVRSPQPAALTFSDFMNSTRTTTIGIGLIMVIFFAWFMLNQPKKSLTPPKRQTTADTTGAQRDSQRVASAPTEAAAILDTAHRSTLFPHSTTSTVRAHIETPLFNAEVTDAGGSISSWVVKNYQTWDKKPLQLVNQADYHGGDVNLKVVGSDGKVTNTKDLLFTVAPVTLDLRGDDSGAVHAFCYLDSLRYIEKIFEFTGSRYAVTIHYRLVGLENVLAGYHYSATIENPLPYVEQASSGESAAALAFAGMKNGTEEVNAGKVNDPQSKEYNGDVDFVASRTQYFIQALVPIGPKPTAAEVKGNAITAPDGGTIEKYAVGVTLPLLHQHEENLVVSYYLGPLEYDRIQGIGVGLENTMNFGWSFLVRPISIHLMRPLLMWIHGFISNWGLVIILFSIFIKLVTIPLSTGQMKSMRKMQVLQPKVTELREKYKEDAKKMNEELMALYKTYGVNPAGGCLPMLLQMPILFALYAVLRNVIELRQAPFGLWIHDLSIPDGLIQFGTKIPVLGSQLSGLTLLLGATMLIQQMFTVTDPKQKTMAYMMPIIFTFMFNGLPSGVALYYFMFNIFGLAQQLYLTKIAKPITLESIKVDPKKQKSGGIMAKLQEMEKSQSASRRDQMTGTKSKKK